MTSRMQGSSNFGTTGSAIRQITAKVTSKDAIQRLRRLQPDTSKIPDLLGVQHFHSPSELLIQEEWTTSNAANQASDNPTYKQYLDDIQSATGSKPQMQGPFDRVTTS